MKRLYHVRAEWYVMATDAIEAQYINPNEIETCTVSVRRALNVGGKWKNARPFNSDDDHTCAEILSAEIKGQSP